ncbi:MAG: HAD family hydrolase [bacterium]
MSLWLPGSASRPGETVPVNGDAPAPVPTPILFLDRDGVIIEDRNYISRPEQVVLIPGVATALRRARDAGLQLVGISNQSGIGRGLYSEDDFVAVQTRVDQLLAREQVVLDALYYCPHAPEENCDCRKPAPGLLREARRHFAWTPSRSWLVGDKVSDVELARAEQLGALLVLTGQGAQQRQLLPGATTVRVCADLDEAVAWILGEERS